MTTIEVDYYPDPRYFIGEIIELPDDSPRRRVIEIVAYEDEFVVVDVVAEAVSEGLSGNEVRIEMTRHVTYSNLSDERQNKFHDYVSYSLNLTSSNDYLIYLDRFGYAVRF